MKFKPCSSSKPTAFFETLERRDLLSVSTSTSVAVSAKSLLFGQAVTVTVAVTPSKGTATPSGTIELLDNKKSIGASATLDAAGLYVFSFTAQNALLTGKYSFSARYLGSSHFAGSISKPAPKLTISPPTLTTAKDGLETATVRPGKGTAKVVAGSTVVIADTGYDQTGALKFESIAQGNGFAKLTVDATPNQTIPAFNEGLIGMKVGETRVIVAPSALALNDGKTYYFVVQLKSIVS